MGSNITREEFEGRGLAGLLSAYTIHQFVLLLSRKRCGGQFM
jgi:monoamine oxidase